MQTFSLSHWFKAAIIGAGAVRALNGIPSIVSILKKVKVETIQNRACRALANLAVDEENAEILVHSDLLEHVIDNLSKTETSECQQTYVRFIRILGSKASNRSIVCKADGLKAVALLLTGSGSGLLTAVTRTIAEYTKGYSVECIQQILEADTLTSLVQLASHSDPNICDYSLEALLNICHQPHARPPLGAAGAIQFFIDHINNTKDLSRVYGAITALCLCCRDSVNRVRLRESAGLKLLLQLLSSEDYSQCHTQIICSLTCFLYDELSLEVLLKEGMVKGLLGHLTKSNHITLEEIESDSDSDSDCAQSYNEQTDQSKIQDTSKDGHNKGESHSGHETVEMEKNENKGQQIGEVKDRRKFFKTQTEVLNVPAENRTEPNSADDRGEVSQHVDGRSQLQLPGVKGDSSSVTSPSEGTNRNTNIPFPRAHSMPSLSSMPGNEQGGVGSESFRSLSPPISHHSSLSRPHSPAPPSQFVSWVRSPSPPTPYTASSMSPMSYLSPEWSPEYTGPSWGGWEPRYSPQHAGSSPYSMHSPGMYSPGPSSPDMEVMPQWSPVHSPEECSPQGLETETPDESFPALFPELQYAQYSNNEDERKELTDDVAMETKMLTDPVPDVDNLKDIEDREVGKSTNLCEDPPSPQTHSTSINLAELLASPKAIHSVEVNPVKTMENNILMLLSRVSQMPDPSPFLCTPNALIGLFTYALTVKKPNPRWFRICSRLTKNTICFEAFLLNSGAALIHEYLVKQKYRPVAEGPTILNTKNTDTESSVQEGVDEPYQKNVKEVASDVIAEEGRVKESIQSDIKEREEKKRRDLQLVCFGKSLHHDLTLQAETPYGQGVLCHILLKKPNQEKMRCAVDLPHVCSSKKLRTKFMLDYRGLSYLLDAIQAHCDDHSQYPMAVESLCVLARQLIMDCPRFSSNSELDVIQSPECIYSSTLNQHNMRFMMTADQTVISAERSKVSGASETFTAMLEGHYSESGQDEIYISEASGSAFCYLLHFLHGCRSGCDVIAGNGAAGDTSVDVDLETLSLSDRYILPALQRHISTVIAQKHWNASHIVHIYRYASMHNCENLSRDCLKFMLVGKLKWSERSSVLLEIFSGPNRDQVRKEIGHLLVELL
ncbi:armadillo repeat-containing protein 5 [Lingula anatina]|uniref:Armadillo repeat-containing protein 5 n=1 Tax=Lingula anatina TaxID=7574 RepID=A0A2R2MIM5_LINAN|nr:armadillo repeat-containing protein 5 [Lingula anatina]|eukprot:XP_023930081.1 armadillo repeat-containing protein 5 [Lingula anatina]